MSWQGIIIAVAKAIMLGVFVLAIDINWIQVPLIMFYTCISKVIMQERIEKAIVLWGSDCSELTVQVCGH